MNVIAIFDVGKTNKKLLLFDEDYNVVFETSKQLEETADEDGYACEDVEALTEWVKQSFDEVLNDERFDVKAVNFSGYGASFVYLDNNGAVVTPLYNYLKPFSRQLQQNFYRQYGGESLLSKQTSSPVLGNLNSGMQLYRLKYEQPGKFEQIKYALHLPQYLNYILSKKVATDITSIGCHTNLWFFQYNRYHNWVQQEGIDKKFTAIIPCTETITIKCSNKNIEAGFGLHDSSAALIPYLETFKEPFILLSTGTWCITLNPFNHTLLSDYELSQDCLCYLTFEGKPVKASRLFAGYEHEEQVKKMTQHFKTEKHHYKKIAFDKNLIKKLTANADKALLQQNTAMVAKSGFEKRLLEKFESIEEAYHQFMLDIIAQQVVSTKLVMQQSPVKHLYVDGGFSKNDVFMNLLAAAFPDIEVYAADVAQASSLGAALAIHHSFSKRKIPGNLVSLKRYTV